MGRIHHVADRVLTRLLANGTAAADECQDVRRTKTELCGNGCYRTCSRTCRVCRLGGTTCGSWSCYPCNLCP